MQYTGRLAAYRARPCYKDLREIHRRYCLDSPLERLRIESRACAAAPRSDAPGDHPAAPAATASALAPAPTASDDDAIARAEHDYIALVVVHLARDSDGPRRPLTRHGPRRLLARRRRSQSPPRRGDAGRSPRPIPRRLRPPSPHARISRSSRAALAVDVRTRRALKPLERKPDAYTDPMSAIFMMAARDYAPVAERARSALSRIEKLPAVVALARTNLDSRPASGCRSASSRPSADAFFVEQRAFLLGALPGETPRIDAAISAAKKAYAGYARFLEHDVLPRAGGGLCRGQGALRLPSSRGVLPRGGRRSRLRRRQADLRLHPGRDGRGCPCASTPRRSPGPR